MCNRHFGNEIQAKLDKLYEDVVRPQHGRSSSGGCMAAVYDGALTALYGETFAKEFRRAIFKKARKIDEDKGQSEGTSNTIDLVFETLRQEGRAGEPWLFRHKRQKWTCESPAAFSGKGVEEAIAQSLLGQRHGWYFFGVSASAGRHSVVLAVHHQAAARKIFWLDQFAKGCKADRNGGAFTATGNVTGRLDQALTNVDKDPTRLWPLCAKGQESASQWAPMKVA